MSLAHPLLRSFAALAVLAVPSLSAQSPPPPDCNSNGIDDADDISDETSPDCNGNGIPDECDLATGVSVDFDSNGVPDACEVIDQPIGVEVVVTGLNNPLYVLSPPGDFDRLFVLEQYTGRVRIVENGAILATPFIDIGSLILGDGQHGLLGLAFHPNYAINGRFFLSYSDLLGGEVLAEYSVSGDPNIANPTPVATMFTHPMSSIHHYGGSIRFGPDGMLYLGIGDDGVIVKSQLLNSYLGKMLRYDVDIPAPWIPADNPFLGVSGAHPEIWSFGLRNPWGFTFDRATGDMWIADPGAASWEEIDVQPASSTGGENYAWPCMEGDHCLTTFVCTCMDPQLAYPVFEYAQNAGNCAIIGGYMYRGSAIPGLAGTYFYGDHCGGRVWSFRYDGNNVSQFRERTSELSGPFFEITGFGEDAAGELYIVDRSGGLYRIVGGCAPPTNYCVGAPNTVGPGGTISHTGSTSVAANNLVLRASNVPGNDFGIFYYGTLQTIDPFGEGFRCIAGFTARLVPPAQSSGAGIATRQVDMTAPPELAAQITVGSQWNFQYWYRDNTGGPIGFNLSDAMQILFCP